MTQQEIIKAISEKSGETTAAVKLVLTAQAELAAEHLKSNDDFTLHGIGKIKAKTSAERQGRNPATGENITIKASRNIRLTAGKTFRDSLQ